MRKRVNLALIFFALATLVAATIENARLRAAAKNHNDSAASVLKRNEAMQAQLASLQQAPPPTADGADAGASALLAAKDRADEDYRARIDQARASAAAFYKMQAAREKNDTELALKRYASMRADAEAECAPFCRARHLSKEQSARLAEAEFQRMLRIDDMLRTRLPDEPDLDTEALREQANDEFASNARAALGDDLSEQFSIYERQGAAWECARAWAGNMSVVDMPLSVEQAARLAGAIANACPAFQDGKAVDMNTMNTVDWNAVDAAAVDFLTPEQMDFFKNSANAPDATSRHYLRFINAIQNLAQ